MYSSPRNVNRNERVRKTKCEHSCTYNRNENPTNRKQNFHNFSKTLFCISLTAAMEPSKHLSYLVMRISPISTKVAKAITIYLYNNTYTRELTL